MPRRTAEVIEIGENPPSNLNSAFAGAGAPRCRFDGEACVKLPRFALRSSTLGESRNALATIDMVSGDMSTSCSARRRPSRSAL